MAWYDEKQKNIVRNNNGTYTQNGVVLKDNYTTNTITPAMSYAITQAGGNPNDIGAADKYAESLLSRVGTASANTGKTLSLADVQAELSRLGYQNSTNGNWTTVGSQSYLTGGDDYDSLKNFYGSGADIYNGTVAGGSPYTEKQTVVPQGTWGGSTNGTISNSGIQLSPGYNAQDSYVDMYSEALAKQLEQIKAQQDLAKEESDRQKRQAYVAMKLGQRALAEQNAASGLQDSGYSESSNMALTANYGNNLNDIASNYQQYLNNINNNYTSTALSGAETLADMQRQSQLDALQQQQYADQLAQQAWENAFKERQYNDSLSQYEAQQQLYAQENDYTQSKARADAALSMGVWNEDVQRIYGLTAAQVKANFSKGSTSTSTSGESGNNSTSSSYVEPIFTGTTYAQAVQFLNSIGQGANAGGILSASEFERRKNAGGSLNGVPLSSYSSYPAYLADMVEYYAAQ